MDINMIGALVGAFGIGGLITAAIQLWHENKNRKNQRLFDEKKQAYLEYIKAMNESQFMPPKEGGWLRTAAMSRLELFASKDVLNQLEKVSQIKNGDLTEPLQSLLKAMRQDLDSYY